MIQVNHITKYFGSTKAVSDLSFSVGKGEVFVLLGTSGCGKTTTLKMINRLSEPDEGNVLINGQDIRKERPEDLRRKIGYVMQHTGLFPHFTVRENASIVPDLLGWDKSRIENRARILLEKFRLPPDQYLDLYPSQLSGGQQQRVGFVRALMADPPVILMDEPLGALDPITRGQIRKEFRQLDELNGKTIILVTHDIPEAIELGDRICLMDQGKAQQTGTAMQLLADPANDFVRKFFSGSLFTYKLKALKLRDVLVYLEPAETNASKEFEVDAEKDLLEIIEALTANAGSEKRAMALDKTSGKYYTVSPSLLLSLLYRIHDIHDIPSTVNPSTYSPPAALRFNKPL